MNPLALTDVPIASPHAHGGNSVTRTMFRVQAALVPATLFAFWMYGWPSFFLFVATIASCVGWEALSLRLAGRTRIRGGRRGCHGGQGRRDEGHGGSEDYM